MEKRLRENDSFKYIVGNRMTIADIDCCAFAYSYIFNERHPIMMEAHKKFLEQYPIVAKYFRGLGEIFKDYLDARPKCRV